LKCELLQREKDGSDIKQYNEVAGLHGGRSVVRNAISFFSKAPKDVEELCESPVGHLAQYLVGSELLQGYRSHV